MKKMTTTEVMEKLDNNEDLTLLDVREIGEVESDGKIPGAINVPLSVLESKLQELDKDKEYHIICHAGGRSARAQEFLESQGFKTIDILGGMSAWEGKRE
ncbi:rhodanese-like domain-containing protein [Peribacillus alkalitolerans]|uniref:rhodanese-like domain-containing protein n=1 Tax=Peribacillus alkalitolerans TaxID=1550385 RepID=UPI0013D5C514|nr:rhodanese-like domain-containing protein [Peribacillus alkalitolerans]